MKNLSILPLLIASSALCSTSTLLAADATKPATTEKPAAAATISPADLAKSKNVPASIKNPQGDFTLVAVVEGAEANRNLTQSLKIVGAQRQRLSNLTRQFEQTSTEFPQQRELLATQINEIRRTLQTNLQFMSKNFAYSLNYNYVMVPHESTLVEVIQKEGKPETKDVYEFKNSTSYEDCQKKRDAYVKLKQAHITAAATKAKEAGKPMDEAALKALKPTADMVKAQKELIKLFKYDPEKNYQVNFKKTAVYARPIR